MSTPASCLNISPATRLDALPLPKVSLPGFFLAKATRSPTLLCGDAGLTTSTCPPLPRPVMGAKSFTGSYESFLYRCSLAACVVLVVMRMVWPSGAALATAAAAIMPLAPALLSTTTACLVSLVMDWPMARASWSVALPAANGTTKVMGLAGKVCAAAGAVMDKAIRAPAAAVSAWRRVKAKRLAGMLSPSVLWVMSNENGGHHVAGPARCWRSAAGTCTGNDSSQ